MNGPEDDILSAIRSTRGSPGFYLVCAREQPRTGASTAARACATVRRNGESNRERGRTTSGNSLARTHARSIAPAGSHFVLARRPDVPAPGKYWPRDSLGSRICSGNGSDNGYGVRVDARRRTLLHRMLHFIIGMSDTRPAISNIAIAGVP